MIYEQESSINADFKKVSSGFNIELFNYLAPSFPKIEVTKFEGIQKEDLIQLKIKIGIKTLNWSGKITHFEKNQQKLYFVDIGTSLPFPFKSWKHHHLILNNGHNKTIIVDKVEHEMISPLFNFFAKMIVKSMLRPRISLYRKYFE